MHMRIKQRVNALRLRAKRVAAASRNRWHESPSDPFRVSYAQCGEDLIIDYMFACVGRRVETYLDIGAHDPVRLSNTMRFYRQGARGVCVEPDPDLVAKLVRDRPEDVCVQSGVGVQAGTATFYLLTPSTLNTFSRHVAEQLVSTGLHHVRQEVEVPVVTINHLIATHFNAAPDLVSIDVEGLEYDLIRSFDFNRYRPVVFCVESARYSPFDLGRKSRQVDDYLRGEDYECIADTFINSIFVDKREWDRREKEMARHEVVSALSFDGLNG